MEDVKMSDTFTLPLSFRICGDKGGELIENGFTVFMRGCKYKTEAACIAINSYDQHIELIAKQAEQIKMLREAIKRTLSTGVEFINSCDVDDEEDRATLETNFNNSLISAEKALSATEPE